MGSWPRRWRTRDEATETWEIGHEAIEVRARMDEDTVKDLKRDREEIVNQFLIKAG